MLQKHGKRKEDGQQSKSPWSLKKETREKIVGYYFDGWEAERISETMGLPIYKVKAVIASNAIKRQTTDTLQDIKKEICKDKVPLLKEIVELSLTTVKEFLHNLQKDDFRKETLSIRDAKDLTSIATDLNEFLRLELGQSTQNITVAQVTMETTHKLLQELSQIDPILEYNGPIQAEPVIGLLEEGKPDDIS